MLAVVGVSSPHTSSLANAENIYPAVDTESFKGLSLDGRRAYFSKKTSATLPLIKIYRMSLLSAGSISLDSTFKPLFANLDPESAQNGSKNSKTPHSIA